MLVIFVGFQEQSELSRPMVLNSCHCSVFSERLQTETLADYYECPSPSVILPHSETRLEHICALTITVGTLLLCRPADLQGSLVPLIHCESLLSLSG